jgi:hypothetical protein
LERVIRLSHMFEEGHMRKERGKKENIPKGKYDL